MLADLVRKNRTYRRFHQAEKVGRETLKELAGLARLSASGGNMQPLKFMLSSEPEKNAEIFPCLRWAGYLKDWPGPGEGERPAAYIVILNDNEIRKGAGGTDYGIAAQSITLGAVEKGLGCCMIGSIDRDALRQVLNLPERYDISLVIAIGKPSEKVVLEETGPDGDIKYYRDDQDVHHVPKRPLGELILE